MKTKITIPAWQAILAAKILANVEEFMPPDTAKIVRDLKDSLSLSCSQQLSDEEIDATLAKVVSIEFQAVGSSSAGRSNANTSK